MVYPSDAAQFDFSGVRKEPGSLIDLIKPEIKTYLETTGKALNLSRQLSVLTVTFSFLTRYLNDTSLPTSRKHLDREHKKSSSRG